MLISESGGIAYHLKAYRYQKRLWVPFRERLARWLEESWAPPRNRPLILIGSSAGWCLPPDFIAGFPQVHAVDQDPLALWLLKKRMKSAKITTHVQDGLGIHSTPPAESLREFLDSHGKSDPSILFCNLWGQVFLEKREEERQPFWRRELEKILEHRNWASFQDRVSGDIKPDISTRGEASAGRLLHSQIIERFYENSIGHLTGELELLDHNTGDFFPELPRLHLEWELQPGKYHLIEAIHAH